MSGGLCGGRLRFCRRLHAWQQNVANDHGSVGLPVPSQSPVILSPPKVLDIELGGRMIHDLADDAHAIEGRLADSEIALILIKQDAVELEARADVGVPVIQPDDVSFAYAILARTILKDSVHGCIPAMRPHPNC